MHLRDARVDLEGRIVGPGNMTYPKDEADTFMLPAHDNICIDIRDGRTLRAGASSRDPESGFLVSALVGPLVILPMSIKAVILETLRAYQPTPLRLQSTDQDGQLVAEGFAQYQPLSDWRLEIDVDQNCLKFRLSPP
jgi:hypothetical protein